MKISSWRGWINHLSLLQTEERNEGNREFPSSITGTMTREDQIESILKLTEPLLEGDMFLVGARIKPINNIRIYIDADNGLPIERCIKLNRALYKSIEEAALFPDGDFSLEVSSPGVEEPLKLHRQYKKNIGRDVEVIFLDATVKKGKLISVQDDTFTLTFTEGKGKKAETKELEIAFKDVKQTTVLLKF